MNVKVKICGVADPANAEMAVGLGADLLGLNFCAASPRYVSVARAREIAEAVRGRVTLVGVFVNSSRQEIEDVAGRVGLDLLQFSGDEGPDELAPFAGRAIKAFRSGGDPGAAALAPYDDVWGLLFDAPHGTLYGGTGAAWSYESVAQAVRRLPGRRVFLAGGLGPDNVRRAIEVSHPFAVDVCSRVESAPGIKDPELLRRLFQEVQHAQAPSAS
ncbi:MAG TPA: phosphoribosylanthranilate isomerase [Thermoanaerobaculia bacterium]|jgi:phosphoribosylanthranilate isomerase|nr:phosphoribosylanthranilate isomerase [Thermoanaerobaculia bacterium]